MIKRLLFSAMAVAAMAFSANADTYSLMDKMGTGGWDSSYDAATKTITYDSGWTGRGVWFGTPGFDASDYDELVFECEATAMSFNLVVQYSDDSNGSLNFAAGSTKAILELDADLKNDIKQIYIQASAAGTIVVKDLYFQNAVEVDPSIPVVVFDGEMVFDNWQSLDIPTSWLVMSKFAPGDKLVFEYTAEEGNGFKLLYKDPAWSWVPLPLMEGLEGYNEAYNTISLPADKHEIAITVPQEDYDILMSSENHGGLVQADKMTITKISVVHAAAQAEASNWFISGEFNSWNNGASAEYAMMCTATEGVYEYSCAELSGEFLIVWSENGTPDWSKKLSGVTNMEANTAYAYVENGNSNFSLKNILKNATVILDTNAKTIQVNGTVAANEFDTVYLIGNFGDGWNETNTDMPLTLKEGTTDTYAGTFELTAATSYFKFKAGSIIYGTGGADVAVDIDTPYTAAKGGNAFSLGEGKYDFECTVAADGETANFIVKPAAGITDITVDNNAPVEYFNLQGVRVAEPTTGLYIRRQGGKATKVYVK